MGQPDTTGDGAAPASGVRYLVLAWLCVAATVAYIQRGAIAVPVAQIQNDLGLSDERMSWILSGFFLGYAIFQVPSGWLGDRWGTRIALSAFALAWSTATALIGLSTGFFPLFLSQIAGGVAQAGIFPCCIQSIARWFPSTQRALPSGLLSSFMSIGGVLTTALTGFLLVHLSWHTLFPLLALPGLLWTAGFFWWFRDRPDQHRWVNDAELTLIREGGNDAAPHAARPTTPWLTLLTSPQMAFICGQQFFRAAGYIFYMTWFPTYLQKTRGVSIEHSGYLGSLPLLGVVIGAPLGGALSDWIQRRTGSRRLSRQAWAIGNMLACALSILAAYFIDDVAPAVALLTLGTFFAGMGGPAGYTITMDLGGRHVATVFSLMNMAGNVGAMLCPLVVAQLVARTGQWNLVLLLFVAIYVASVVCWLLLDPNQPIFVEPGESAPTI